MVELCKCLWGFRGLLWPKSASGYSGLARCQLAEVQKMGTPPHFLHFSTLRRSTDRLSLHGKRGSTLHTLFTCLSVMLYLSISTREGVASNQPHLPSSLLALDSDFPFGLAPLENNPDAPSDLWGRYLTLWASVAEESGLLAHSVVSGKSISDMWLMLFLHLLQQAQMRRPKTHCKIAYLIFANSELCIQLVGSMRPTPASLPASLP